MNLYWVDVIKLLDSYLIKKSLIQIEPFNCSILDEQMLFLVNQSKKSLWLIKFISHCDAKMGMECAQSLSPTKTQSSWIVVISLKILDIGWVLKLGLIRRCCIQYKFRILQFIRENVITRTFQNHRSRFRSINCL